MQLNIKILNTSGNLIFLEEKIKRVVNNIEEKIKTLFSYKDIDVVFKEAEKPELLKDLGGIGAYCPSGDFIQISFDVSQKISEKKIEKALLHELHHALRRQAGIEIDKSSFLENMFSEGLADFFVYQMTGELSEWIKPIKEDKFNFLLKKFKKIANKKFNEIDYETWFLNGSEKENIPKWAGYVLSFNIVKNFLETNTDYSLKTLTSISVDKINLKL